MDERVFQKFYTDPDWKLVEDMFTSHLEPLMDMTTIDTKQPAETVKAEVIARTLSYNVLTDILNDSHLLTRKLEKKKEIFR